MQTIYLDVLLLQSLYVNYFLLRAAARVTHTPLRFTRCLLVSAGSSLFSLLIFLPALPLLLQLLLKLTAAAATVSLAFGIQRGRWLGQFGCFFGCSFLLAGLLLAVCSTANQGFATWSNSCFYLDFSLFQLILFTALAYLLLHLCDFFRGRRHHTDEHFQVLMQKRAMSKDSFPGKYDTSSAGHIQAGDEPLASGLRELAEELGIHAKPEDLAFAGCIHGNFAEEFHGKIFRDNEIAFVYVYQQPVDIETLVLQKEEVESVRWFDLEETYQNCRNRNTQFCAPVPGLEVVRCYLYR